MDEFQYRGRAHKLEREREKGPPLHLLLFHPAEVDDLHVDLQDGGLGLDLGLDLDDIFLQAKNLINQMLTVNPAKRIRAEEVLLFFSFLCILPTKFRRLNLRKRCT